MERMMLPEGDGTASRSTALEPLKTRTLHYAAIPMTGLLAITCVLSGCGAPSDGGPTFEPCKDLPGTCVLSNGMSLQTRTAPAVLTPIDVSVRDVSTSVTSVRLEASMAGMSMPPVGVDLRGSGPSEWSGQLILPVCSQSRTDWQWTVVTRVGSGEQRTTIQVEAAPR